MTGLQITTVKDTSYDSHMNIGVSAAAIMLFAAGVMKILATGFVSIASFWWFYAILSALLYGALCYAEKYLSKWKNYIVPVLIGVLAGMVLLGFSSFRNGYAVLANDFLNFLTGKTGKVHLDYAVTGIKGVHLLLTIIIVLMILICKNTIGYLFFIYLFIVGSFTRFFAIDYGWLLLLSGFILHIFVKQQLLYQIKSMLYSVSHYAVICCICALFCITAALVMDYEFKSNHITNSIETTIHRMKYDSGENSMPEGNLRNLPSLRKSNETALKLQAEVPQKFYLRGMVGEQYTGIAWEGLTSEAKISGEDLFYWLHKNDFYGQKISGSVLNIVSESSSNKLNIENISACRKYQYLPYALSDSQTLDSRLIGDSNADYVDAAVSYQYFLGSVPEWYEAVSQLALIQNESQAAEFLKLEQSYKEFVYKNYLQLTNSAVGVLDRVFAEDMVQEKGLGEILTLIRDTLETKLEYDESIITFNGDNDFLKYTLEQSKKGYSVHYATAAALMLRYFGVPARYVEGYFISAEEASKYSSMETVELTEAHAHAWTEYYMDGIGWIPFEVTPGYIDEEELQATEQIIANGMGEGKGNAYSQSKLTYTPPKQQEEEKNSDWNSLFEFQVKHLVSLLMVLLLAVLTFVLYRIWKRRKKLLAFEQEIVQMDDRDAIVELFAYGKMLSSRCDNYKFEYMQQIEQINKEALFSNHQMKQEYRELIYEYVKAIISVCKKRTNRWHRFRDHYLLWLYR